MCYNCSWSKILVSLWEKNTGCEFSALGYWICSQSVGLPVRLPPVATGIRAVLVLREQQSLLTELAEKSGGGVVTRELAHQPTLAL